MFRYDQFQDAYSLLSVFFFFSTVNVFLEVDRVGR